MSNIVSIIVPVYNLESELSKCIKSIQNQTYSNIEIIIVDDGSSDGSKEIIKRLADSDHRIVSVYKENGGVTSARLAGVEASTGEWVGFVDGDDEIEPDMIEFLLNNALKYGAQISHCGYQVRFPDGRVNYFYNTGCLAEQDKITALKELLSGSRIEPGLCNKLFNKSLFHSLLQDSVMDSSIKINEDLLMNYYLFKEAKKSIYEDRCPYHYLVRYSSVSRQGLNENKIYDPIKVKRIIIEDAEDALLDDARRAYIRTCINVYNGLVCDRIDAHSTDKRKIRDIVLNHRGWLCLLTMRTRLLGYLVCYFPSVYPLLYKVYEKIFQKKKYI